MFAQSAGFTYQGRLRERALVASGIFDFRFTLKDAPSAGVTVGVPFTNSTVQVVNGLFTVALDFGPGVFDGSPRWLEVAVRTNGSSGGYVVLEPRQPMTAAPYAAFAYNAASATTASNLTPGVLINGNGAGITNITGYIPSQNGRGTNTALFSGSSIHSLTVTNDNTTNFVTDIFLGNTGTYALKFSQIPGDGAYGNLLVNTIHNGPLPSPNNVELQWASGSHFAFGTGAGDGGKGHIQWGIGHGNQWAYRQSVWPPTLSTNTPFGNSFADAWRASGLVAGSGVDYMPGLLSRFVDVTPPNGIYELDIFADLGNNTGPGRVWTDGWSADTIHHGIAVYGGNKYGVRMHGGLMLERSTAISSGVSVPLDFGLTYLRDIVVTASSIMLYTTNWWSAGNTNIEPRIFYLRGRGITAVNYPIGWNTNGAALPGALNAGQMIRLQLEATGLGETNIQVTSAQLLSDNTFSFDPDALSFFAAGRANISNTTQREAVNTLVKAAKQHGWWTNCDAIYPFVGGNATAHSKNLKADTFNITWHGTLTNDANGVTGDGATGYGDTGFNFKTAAVAGAAFNTNSAHLFVYGGTLLPMDSGNFIGGYRWVGTSSRAGLQRDGSFVQGIGLNDPDGSMGPVGAGADFRGPILETRTGMTAQAVAIRSAIATGNNTSAIEPPNAPCALLARIDQSGNLDYFSNANLRGATIGGGMTQAQWDVFRADWDTFESMLSRKVP